MAPGQLLTGQGETEIGIARANQVEDLLAQCLVDPVVGTLAAAAGNQPRAPPAR